MTREIIKGTDAVAKAVVGADPDVVSAYPITPQTGIVEGIADLAADGHYNGEFLRIDSEFNAASSVIGASAAGARTFTATSSNGLKLMSEPLFTAAGMRLPLVLAVANRSISAPLSIWNDHTDTMAERDSGLIQLYAEDVQEAVDNTLIAFRVAEELKLPVMSNLDGFVLTHVQEPVDVPEPEPVEEFLPPYEPEQTLDPSEPKTMGAYARPEHWTEAKYVPHEVLLRAGDAIERATAEFEEVFGRSYGDAGGLVDTYRLDDADVALLTLGSLAGTAKDAVDRAREDGIRVGVVRPRVFRPFPGEALREVLGGVEAVGVLEKAISPGSGGPLSMELKSELYNLPDRPLVRDFVIGLAGRDITVEDVVGIADELYVDADVSPHEFAPDEEEVWPQLREEILPEEVSH
ncbi:pyruvate ferredoxin oxidoreductase alpha subunit [Halalkaliarchaeum desulfuricum]|uniref:Pyruvate ferredoxin oxidoreductase alpha subunit n=1 Tax=Halalkaliarchaeum desulfuricum TaxID=2055893 RepID=A0A343TFA5_9EURY|nr:transketolase C-terminal domain-containing protein [Halalkaliarchaeum desulfuricum]AUX07777.1 pyruvate ferredoxin oxidoreductase alpha subunit [Halalkaliarchaeum desulfuricum]